MRRRITVVGLAALCALALSAVAASGAQAAGATAYTCVAGAGEHNLGSDCVPGTTGEYGHVNFGTTDTQLTVNGQGEQVLEGITFGAQIKLTGQGLHCEGCMAQNGENGAGEMEVSGSGGRLVYTEVTTNLPGCTAEDPVAGPETVRTEPLKFTTTSPTSATIEPATGSLLAVIHLVGPECILPGEFPISGAVTGSVNGAILSVKEAPLTLGEEDESFLTGKATLEAGPTGGEHHAAALTAS